MEKISISTLAYQGNFIYISDEQAKTFKPDALKAWEFDCTPYLAGTVIEVGRGVNSLRLTDERGLGDADALEMARAKMTALALVKGWNRQAETGETLPITAESMDSLPGSVLLALRIRLERGQIPTNAEVEAMKLPTSPSTMPTSSDEG